MPRNKKQYIKQIEPIEQTMQADPVFMQPTCSTCKAYDSGMCRMNPPVPMHGFPKLLKTEWCLQHTLNEVQQ
jgi:hypothetical protein